MQVQMVLDEQWKRALHFAAEQRDKIEALAHELQSNQARVYYFRSTLLQLRVAAAGRESLLVARV
jgi:hypothetical protein